MATIAGPPVIERKRVKVYELKSNDWHDRGTGFCISQTHNQSGQEEPRLSVQSEDDPKISLLETRVSRDDGYQKQQDTLIVWTGPNGIDMALSFQEAEGCAATWAFVSQAQQRLNAAIGSDQGLSEDLVDPSSNPAMLPIPALGNLAQVENIMRAASATAHGRDALAKFIMAPENLYIQRLVPLVEMAEDLEDLEDLHRLCNIVKTLILLNDNAVIEYVVRDEIILGVVGALEYDPDFPSHKANHRQYLADESKFKQVVRIDNPDTTRKIHYTYRLQYLKDVVLARILDDPTFSVLNSLIFFHQVDIVNHIQSNPAFLHQLFSIFSPQEQDSQRKKDAVLFIQNCCAVAKNIQAQSRQQLYNNFINNGLLDVVTFALRNQDATVRVAGTDILVALIDHDPAMMRTYIFKAINEKAKPLTDTLIELLLVEVDLGVKAQMSDAIKVLLDSTANPASMDMLGRTNGDFVARIPNRNVVATTAQTDAFVSNFYDESAAKLFAPLKNLEHRQSLADLSSHDASLFEHLVGILCFFIRQHAFRSKFFTLSEGLHCRVAQLISSPQKHLKLTALKWFRTCIFLQDEYHNRHLIQHRLFGPIIGLVEETLPRDNLLNSVCLELFNHIIQEGIKQLIDHIVETYRDRLVAIDYVDVFHRLVHRYDQLHYLPPTNDNSFSTQGAETPNRSTLDTGRRWAPSGVKQLDPDEESYFDSLDTEDDTENALPTPIEAHTPQASISGHTPPSRPLVAYPEDEDEDAMDLLAAGTDMTLPSIQDKALSTTTQPITAAENLRGRDRTPVPVQNPTLVQHPSPLQERSSENKRRRTDDEGASDAHVAGQISLSTAETPAKRRLSLTSKRHVGMSPGLVSFAGEHQRSDLMKNGPDGQDPAVQGDQSLFSKEESLDGSTSRDLSDDGSKSPQARLEIASLEPKPVVAAVVTAEHGQG